MILVAIFTFLVALAVGIHASQMSWSWSPENKIRVPIVLGVMSRCPDALLCESVLDNVFAQSWDKIDVKLSFIGTINRSDTTFGVTCLHGPDECRGNMYELCAMKVATVQEDWWEFVQCLNFEGKDHIGNEGIASKCAQITNIPWQNTTQDGDVIKHGLQECITNPKQGIKYLQANVKNTAKLGIQKSCSIMISGQIRCVHDGEWKDCKTGHTEEEFLDFINQEYKRLNPEN